MDSGGTSRQRGDGSRSTVSQLGFIVALIGMGTALSLAAAILWAVAHALFKATLFMLVGILDKHAGSREIRRLEGLRKDILRTTSLPAIAAMLLAGLPPMPGFTSKEAMYDTFLKVPGPSWVRTARVIVVPIAAILTFAYDARFVAARSAEQEANRISLSHVVARWCQR